MQRVAGERGWEFTRVKKRYNVEHVCILRICNGGNLGRTPSAGAEPRD